MDGPSCTTSPAKLWEDREENRAKAWMRGVETGRQWKPPVRLFSFFFILKKELNVIRFDMMGKRLYKTYVNLTNIVVRISDGTPEGKEHAVLINSHLDSTLPSPGAADDALAVGIMLDCMRVLIETPDWSPTHAIIFCTSPFSVLYCVSKLIVYKSVQPRRGILARRFSFILHSTSCCTNVRIISITVVFLIDTLFFQGPRYGQSWR